MFRNATAVPHPWSSPHQVRSEYLGPAHFSGAGAGRFPTANSIVADMLAIAQGEQSRLPFAPVAGGDDNALAPASGPLPCRYFFRVPAYSAAAAEAALGAEGLEAVLCPGSASAAGMSPADSAPMTSAEAATCAVRLAERLGLGRASGGVAAMPIFGDM